MDRWHAMEQAAELARRGEAFALATVVWRQGPSSGQQGSTAIITAAGELMGWIGGACAEPSVMRQAQQVIEEGEPRLLLLGASELFGDVAAREGVTIVPISCQSDGALEVYIEPILPAPHLVIVGRSPMTHALRDLARVLGWNVDLHEDSDFLAEVATEHSMVVVATQGHGDEEAIESAAAARPAYLGLVGSQRRGAAVVGYLAERGVPREQLDRVRVPAGLDLGRTSHAEIAVSILAELVKLRASGELRVGVPIGGLRGESASAGSARATAKTTAAIDPVCGMTVAVGRASRQFSYQGATYYFCSAGCRKEFESDPASYAKKETRC